jgi:hypothetical protein
VLPARYNALMSRNGAFAGLVLVGCLAGCGAAPISSESDAPLVSAPDRGPNGWGTTRIIVEDHLGWPYRLVDLDVLVDGLDVYGGEDVVDLRGKRRVVGVVELEPGRHALDVQARAAVPTAPLGSDDCVVTFRDQRDIAVGLNPAVVVLDLHARGVTGDFGDRLSVAVQLEGADQRGTPVVEGGPQCAADLPFEDPERPIPHGPVAPWLEP